MDNKKNTELEYEGMVIDEDGHKHFVDGFLSGLDKRLTCEWDDCVKLATQQVFVPLDVTNKKPDAKKLLFFSCVDHILSIKKQFREVPKEKDKDKKLIN